MADLTILQAAPKATVVEPAAPLSSMPMWALYHYENGKPVGGSIARGDQIHEWLADLERAGHVIGFGWEIRGQEAPNDWPGWPVDDGQESSEVRQGAAAMAAYWDQTAAADERVQRRNQDGGAER